MGKENPIEANKKVLVLLGGLMLILIFILVYFSIPRNIEVKDIDVGINPPRGNLNSSLTIIEFGDFKCPACKASHPIIEEILNKYDAVLYYRNFPLPMHGEISFLSAEAAQCANEQGKFWEYHDLLYDKQDFLSKDNLKLYARQTGLNEQQFDLCLDNEKYKGETLKDLGDAKKLGLKGTPTFFINGREVFGADKQEIERIIEEELRKIT